MSVATGRRIPELRALGQKFVRSRMPNAARARPAPSHHDIWDRLQPRLEAALQLPGYQAMRTPSASAFLSAELDVTTS